ncbi:MAG: SMP-30/gluconolactonase/LRE family protein [Bacteroidales bacterium]|nr:SMP-30/gluconolactonase/LRE family protein [Bacteroidales bacterium]
MKPWWVGVVLLLPGLAGMAVGQDMPLSQFVQDGETWKTAQAASEKPTIPKPRITIPGLGSATTSVASPDGGTVFAGVATGRHIWALCANEKGELQNPAPYCPLRLKKGATALAVSAMVVDSAGRIYAATPENIQVFDPTGRLSGVLMLPKPGTPAALGWEGENRQTLVVWIHDQKFTRLMKATGLPKP